MKEVQRVGVYEVFAAQHGVASRQQLLDAGLTVDQLKRRVGRGEFEIVHRGVYRATAVPTSWHGEVLAVALATGGVASHRCAAALWGLDGWSEPPVELVIPKDRFTRLPGRLHRTTQWDRIDRFVRSGVPVTGIDRTILDLGAVVGLRRVELAAESALRQELVDWDSLRLTLLRHSVQGRNGVGKLRRLLEARYGDDELPLSEWSRLVFHLAVDAGLPTPKLEHRICDDGGRLIAQVDLAWPRRRVALELDSVRWHLDRASFERDRRKRNRLRAAGWTVHEATWSMTTDQPAHLIAQLRASLTGSVHHSVP